MRSTNERMALLQKRSEELKAERHAKNRKMLTTLSYACCFLLIAGLCLLVSQLHLDPFEPIKLANTASIFTDKHFFGYFAVGILAFLLGVTVTLFCHMLHKKQSSGKDGKDDRAS